MERTNTRFHLCVEANLHIIKKLLGMYESKLPLLVEYLLLKGISFEALESKTGLRSFEQVVQYSTLADSSKTQVLIELLAHCAWIKD